MRALAFVATLLVSTSVCDAGPPYDGSAPMNCAIQTTFVCNSPDLCIRGTAETVSLPSVVTVDVDRRVISGFATGRTARITSVGRGAGQLMIHGEEVETLGRAWGVAITEKSGRMSGAVLSPVGAFLMFGTCTAP